MRVMSHPTYKDVSEAHLAGEDIASLMENLRLMSRPYSEIVEGRMDEEARRCFVLAEELLRCPDILGRFARLCEKGLGLVGETLNAMLLYLAVVTRLLERLVSVCLKGPSAGGKNYVVNTVLSVFPASAYYALSGMSEKALAYSVEPLSHRFLVLSEAAALDSDFATYLIRTLLSEGRLRYETVESTPEGLVPRLIAREGPTGLILTTTAASLHPENETRMLSLVVRDDPAQTQLVFEALAARADGADPGIPDLEPWIALQRWLELAGCREVVIPYAHELARLANPRAVRLRRDFGAVLSLIKAHAVLHQLNRLRSPEGRIIATVEDYTAVHGLVLETVSEGAEAVVSATVRDTVGVVKELSRDGQHPVQVVDVARGLGIDKAAASRRARVAKDRGYLVDLETKRGKPAKLVPGDPLPEEEPVLPSPARLIEGGGAPPSPPKLRQPVNRSAQPAITFVVEDIPAQQVIEF